MQTMLSLLILSQVAFVAGERELVAVLSARVRYSLVPQMNDEPPTEKNRLLNGTAIDAGTVSALEYANLELKSENEDLHRENRILTDNLKAASLGAGKSERKDAATDGNAGELRLTKQPDGVRTGPPVLSLSKPIAGDLVYDVTMFTGEDQYGRGWCKNCPKAEAKFCPGGGRLRVTKNTAVADGPQIYPAFRFHDASGRSRYPAKANGEYRQPKDPDDLLDIVERNHGGTPAAATGSAGSMKTHGQIRAFMQQWHDKLGDGTTVRLRWDRTGKQSMSVTRLLKGEPWTIEQVCGKFGHATITTDSTNIPVKEIGFVYRVNSDGTLTFDADPLTMVLPNAAKSYGSTGEAVGVEPVTIILSVVQLAYGLYQVLNPQISVGLGGTVEAEAKLDGEKVTMKFSECPSIQVAAWVTFDLEVQSVEITPRNVHVAFKDQPRNWIKITSRDFSVED